MTLANNKGDLFYSEYPEIEVTKEVDEDINPGYDNRNRTWEVIVEYNGDINKISKPLDAKVEILSNAYAIVTLPEKNIPLLSNYREVEYIERPKKLQLSIINSLSKSCVRSVRMDKNLNLSGKGVIVAILDSGINYMHPDFINDDGTTRILYLWDQTVSGTPPDGFLYGHEFTKDDINNALKAGSEEEAFNIVNSRDIIGHGTAVAGVACGNGRKAASNSYEGAAPEASLIVVKIGRNIDKGFAHSTELMRGIRYVINKAIMLNMPIVINISFGTNDGSHDGRSIFETFIDEISEEWKTNIVIASGNEGSSGNHYREKLNANSSTNVDFTVSSNLKVLWVSLWKSFTDFFNYEIISPNGISSGVINYSGDVRRFVFNNTICYVMFGQPTEYNGDQEIYFQFVSESQITSGVWTIVVNTLNIVSGEFDMWLPTSEVSTRSTYFLNPNPNTTLTIPSTALNAITVGGYDSQLNSIASFSGRGYNRKYNVVKPDLVAPAVSILSTNNVGSYSNFTGTSIAAPHVTGSVALIMEWGIVKRNDPFLYGQKLKAYLQLGANRSNNIEIGYPNSEWGYGKLCLSNVIDDLKAYNSFTKSNIGIYSANINATGQLMQYLPIYEENDPDIDNDESYFEGKNLNEQNKKILSNAYRDIIVKNNEFFKKYLDRVGADTIYNAKYYNETHVISISNEALYDFESNEGRYIIQEDVKLLGLMGRENLEAAGIISTQRQPYLDLRGNGVIVAIIDTGIDYRNNSFINDDNTSRIEFIWDQSLEDPNPPAKYNYGREFSKTDINNALNSKNPLEIVPHEDNSGHGTFLASIAAGKEETDRNYIGAAPDAGIIVVKLKKAKKHILQEELIPENLDEVFESTDVIAAIDYVIDKCNKLHMPVAICLGVGTNAGAHDGNSLFEDYIAQAALENGVVVSVACGNEGKNRSHLKGFIKETEGVYEAELKIGDNESGFTLGIYSDEGDVLSISVISPINDSIPRVPVHNNYKSVYKFVLEKTTVTVGYSFTRTRYSMEQIFIKFKDPTPGIWKIVVYGDRILNGTMHFWLPIKQFIEEDTFFIESESNYTVTIPSTASNVLAVAAYNNLDNSLYVSNSRGPAIDGAQKPILTAPGVNVEGILPTGKGTMSGTSVAAAITSGATALMLEWAFLNNNEPLFNTTAAISFLIDGCDRKETLEYPNYQWGYGTLDLYHAFEIVYT